MRSRTRASASRRTRRASRPAWWPPCSRWPTTGSTRRSSTKYGLEDGAVDVSDDGGRDQVEPLTTRASRRDRAGRPSASRRTNPAGLAAGRVRPSRPSLLGGCGQSSYNYRWDLFFDSVLRPDSLILTGLWLTVSIAVISQVIGVVLGIVGAMGRISRIAPVRVLRRFYVWFFRGTPLLVQITLIYFGLSVTRHLYRGPDINTSAVRGLRRRPGRDLRALASTRAPT